MSARTTSPLTTSSVAVVVVLLLACADGGQFEADVSEVSEPSVDSSELIPELDPEPEPALESELELDAQPEVESDPEPERKPADLPETIEFVFSDGAEHEREPVVRALTIINDAFAQRFGASVEEATILVSDDLGQHEEVIVSELGIPAQHLNITSEVYAQAFPRLVAVYTAHEAYDGSIPFNILAHEWFHVLQHQLAYRGADMHLNPRWMGEGNAVYVEVVPSEERGQPGIRHHYEASCAGKDIALENLEANDDLEAIRRMELLEYCGGFLATERLVESAGEKALIDYWERVGDGAAWRDAFAAAFGVSVDDFYSEFAAYLDN